MKTLLKTVRRSLPLIFILTITTVLLAVPVLLKVSNEVESNRFARKDTLVLDDTTYLHVIYPTSLRIEPPGDTGRPLTAWVTSATTGTTSIAPAAANIQYTVTFTHDGNLLFSNETGAIVPARLTLTPDNSSRSYGRLYVRQAPLIRNIPDTTSFGIEVESPQLAIPTNRSGLPIALETSDQAKWRSFVGFLANPEALPGLASVFVSLAALIVSLKVDRERKTRERRSLIQSIYTLMDDNLPNAIGRLLHLETQAVEERWEQELIRELHDLRTRLEQNRHYQERLLREASEMLRQGMPVGDRRGDILELIEQFYNGELRQHISVLHTILSATRPATPPSAAQVVEAALWLWNTYDEDVHEIVVQSLLWINRQPDGREVLREAFTSGKSKERRLLRDPLLTDLVPDLSSYRYEWPALLQPHQEQEETAIGKWLEKKEFSGHPFSHGVATFDQLLLQSWEPPLQWKAIKACIPTVITGGMDQDREAAARMMRYQLQHAERQTVFVIWQPYLCTERSAEDPLHDPLHAIAWASGESWITLLAYNPGMLLELADTERCAVVELLTWIAGSLNALRLWLRQIGLADNAEGRMLFRLIEESSEAQSATGSTPRGKLLAWLRLRPPGLPYAYLIAPCHATTMDTEHSDYWNNVTAVLAMAQELAQADIMLKLFIPTPPALLDLPTMVNTISLAWSDDALKPMLHTRFHLCSDHYNTFGALFGPQPLEHADDMLIEKAQGSLARMLQLGHAVIRMEVEGDSEEPYLDEDDLRAILDEVRSTTPRRLLPGVRNLQSGIGRMRSGLARLWSTVRPGDTSDQ